MTPDGISKDDWERVQELAVDVVNLSADGEYQASDGATARLLDLLDDLQERYGPLPSLLATRADYVEAPGDREYWLLAAYREAERIGDAKNQRLIAHSLAVHYIEDVPNKVDGTKWLSRLEGHLESSPDAMEAADLVRLRGILSGRP